MSVAYIVLGIVVILILYTLYVYFSSSVTTLATVLDCSKGSVQIDGSKISGASSSNFSFGVWIYLNNWSTTSSGITNIYYRNGTTGNTIHVFMDNTSPSLYVQFSDPTSGIAYSKITTATTVSNPAILVTSNMPLQKWVYLFVSVDSGTYVDIYLDGKMVKTAVLSIPTVGQGAITSTTTTSSTIPGITVGPFQGYITTFQSFGTATDPQTVWSYYMKGNGTLLGTSYGISMNILDNEKVYSSYRLF